ALIRIRFLLERATSEVDLRDFITHDETVSAEVRTAALEQAPGFWSMRTLLRADDLLVALFGRLLLRAEVAEAVRADPKLDPETCAAALARAETWPESYLDLNSTSWLLVRDPNRPMADYRRGLRLAEAANRLAPDSWSSLNTLGVAQY